VNRFTVHGVHGLSCLAATAALLCTLACTDSNSGTPSKADAQPEPVQSTGISEIPLPPLDGSNDEPALDTGPLEVDPGQEGLELGPSGDAERALAVLTDGHSAAQLPVQSADPGTSFNKNLVAQMAPTTLASKVSQHDLEVGGAYNIDIVRRVLRAHNTELVACYDQAKLTALGLDGALRVEFEITAKGSVAEVEVEDATLDSEFVRKCVAESVEAWRFPSPDSGAPVGVDLSFDFSIP